MRVRFSFIAAIAAIFLFSPPAHSQGAKTSFDLDHACIDRGYDAAEKLFQLKTSSKWDIAFFAFLNGRNQRHLILKPSSDPELRAAKIDFVQTQVQAQVDEASLELQLFSSSQVTTDVQKGPTRVAAMKQYNSVEEAAATAVKPIEGLLSTYALLREFASHGMSEISKLSFDLTSYNWNSPTQQSTGPISSQLRSRICFMADQVLLQILQSSPLAVASSMTDLDLIVEGIFTARPVFKQLYRSGVLPGVPNRWKAFPEVVLSVVADKFRWWRYLDRLVDNAIKGKYPDYVRTNVQREKFWDLSMDARDVFKATLGFLPNDGVANAEAEALGAKLAPEQSPDASQIERWNADMRKDLHRQVYAEHAFMKTDLAEPLLQMMMEDFFTPQERKMMAGKSSEPSNLPFVQLVAGKRKKKILYKVKPYEWLFQVLVNARHPMLTPFLLRMGRLDLDRLSNWIVEALSVPTTTPLDKDDKELIDISFSPQQKALQTAVMNLQYAPIPHLQMVHTFVATELPKLTQACSVRPGCVPGTRLHDLVDLHIRNYLEIDALATLLQDSRNLQNELKTVAGMAMVDDDVEAEDLPTFDFDTPITPEEKGLCDFGTTEMPKMAFYQKCLGARPGNRFFANQII